jgi:hypothetical protein
MKPNTPARLLMLVASILFSTIVYPQDYNSRASIAADYRQVTIVAHVKVQKVERIERIGGYMIYRVTADVIELFKGHFPSDAPLVYNMQVDYDYNMDQYRGEKVVFVIFHNNDEATEYSVLENSDREPTRKVISILRGLKTSNKSRQKGRNAEGRITTSVTTKRVDSGKNPKTGQYKLKSQGASCSL